MIYKGIFVAAQACRSLITAQPGLRYCLVMVAFLTGSVAANAVELPLTRVVLSNSGLAQFTHSGRVTGNASVDLKVRLDQVDDILKSLTVFDGSGSIGHVSLPGRTPLAELFRDLPFGPEAMNSSADLLNALTGSEVEISGPVNAKGRVFRVQREETALPNNGGVVLRHRLSLMSPAGLVQAILEDVTELRFADPQIRNQIERLLAGMTDNRAKDQRQVSVSFVGEGEREVSISYVVAAPVWKTAYRLVLPKDKGETRLQGWAVIENLTGGDWKDVEIVLVSGNPVALRQPLYTALFTDRPEIPVGTSVRVIPRTDDVQDGAAPVAQKEDARRTRLARSPQPAAMAPGAPGFAVTGPRPIPPAEPAQSAEAEEAATQLLFRFPDRITLTTGHTMMLPFLDRDVSAERVYLYQPDVSASRPLASARITNNTGAGLPGGLVTAFEVSGDGGTNFVGDAVLPLMPSSATRFANFALDTRTAINRDDRGIVTTTLGKALNGTLTLTSRSRRNVNYEVTAPPDEDRIIVVEEARVPGWQPASTMTDVEVTPTHYRYRIVAPKGQTTKASFVTERTDSEAVVLTDLGIDDMVTRIRGLQNETPALKETIAKLGGIVQEINKARAARMQLDSERARIVADQIRVRSNLQSVGATTDLGRRYIDTLKSQEDRLNELGRLNIALEKEIATKTAQAEDIARALVL